MTNAPPSSSFPDGKDSLDRQPIQQIISRLTRLWIITGLVTSMVAVGVVFLVGKTGANVLSQIGIATACGTLAAFALAPWKHVQALANRAELLKRVAELIHDFRSEDRSDSLREIASRKDEVGELCNAVDELLGTLVSHRVRTHSLKRTMNEQIRRETTRATAALLREATTDSLTGLGNRRALELFLERLQIEAPTKPDRRVAAIVIDVDDFKALNDTAGHRQGDECLRFIGTVLQASVRKDDCALRLGGDEFLVLMMDRSREESIAVAERVTSLLRQMPWPAGAGEPPSVSIGIAEAPMHAAADIDDLVSQADQAMYQAKNVNGSSIATAWQRPTQTDAPAHTPRTENANQGDAARAGNADSNLPAA